MSAPIISQPNPKRPLIVVYGVDKSIGRTGYVNLAKTVSEIQNAAVDYIAGPISEIYGSNLNDFGPKEAVILLSGKKGKLEGGSKALKNLVDQDDQIVAIVPTRLSEQDSYIPINLAALCPESLTSPLHPPAPAPPPPTTVPLLAPIPSPAFVASVAPPAPQLEFAELLQSLQEQLTANKREFDLYKAQSEQYKTESEQYKTESEQKFNAYKTESEQKSSSLCAELKALRERINEFEEDSEAIHGWISDRDTVYMDKLRLRHALNLAQAHVACLAGLALGGSRNVSELSRAWRLALDAEASDEGRVAKARELLSRQNAPEDLVEDPDLLNLLVQKRSALRAAGDAVAHPAKTTAEAFWAAIRRLYPNSPNVALNKLVLYAMKFE